MSKLLLDTDTDGGVITGKTAVVTLTGTESVLVDDAGTLKKTTAQSIADLGGGGGASNYSVCAVDIGSNSIPDSSSQVLKYQYTDGTYESFGGSDNYDASTGLFTVPEAGKYKVRASVKYSPNTVFSFSEYVVLYITKNGTNRATTYTLAINKKVEVQDEREYSINDTIGVSFKNNSGATKSPGGGQWSHECSLFIEKIA